MRMVRNMAAEGPLIGPMAPRCNATDTESDDLMEAGRRDHLPRMGTDETRIKGGGDEIFHPCFICVSGGCSLCDAEFSGGARKGAKTQKGEDSRCGAGPRFRDPGGEFTTKAPIRQAQGRLRTRRWGMRSVDHRDFKSSSRSTSVRRIRRRAVASHWRCFGSAERQKPPRASRTPGRWVHRLCERP